MNEKSGEWILFGFGDALADILDVMISNNESLDSIVLNMEINREHLNKYLAIYSRPVKILNIEEFQPEEKKLYNFGFFVPKKRELVQRLHDFKLNFMNLIHKTASLSTLSSYKEGLLIGPQVVVTAYSSIGSHVRLNRTVSIGHHCVIHDYVHVGPSVTIAGYCTIGEGTFIGAGSVIKNHINIGKNVLIGAGSVVVNDIPDNVVAYGCPAKEMRKNI